MYTKINFKTKKAIKEALAAGDEIGVYQPGPFGKDMANYTGAVVLEGPHFPESHRWYASGFVENGLLVKIK